MWGTDGQRAHARIQTLSPRSLSPVRLGSKVDVAPLQGHRLGGGRQEGAVAEGAWRGSEKKIWKVGWGDEGKKKKSAHRACPCARSLFRRPNHAPSYCTRTILQGFRLGVALDPHLDGGRGGGSHCDGSAGRHAGGKRARGNPGEGGREAGEGGRAQDGGVGEGGGHEREAERGAAAVGGGVEKKKNGKSARIAGQRLPPLTLPFRSTPEPAPRAAPPRPSLEASRAAAAPLSGRPQPREREGKRKSTRVRAVPPPSSGRRRRFALLPRRPALFFSRPSSLAHTASRTHTFSWPTRPAPPPPWRWRWGRQTRWTGPATRRALCPPSKTWSRLSTWTASWT